MSNIYSLRRAEQLGLPGSGLSGRHFDAACAELAWAFALITALAIALPLPALGEASSPARSGATLAPNGQWNVRDHLPLEKFVIQSHRGAGVLAEEGTLEAFELGWRLGTYPEADLRATRDGVIVTFHDANFQRVVKDASPELKKKGVKDLLWDELSQLDVGSWKGEQFKGRRVLPMATVFELMRQHRERCMYMDVKSVDFRHLAAEVKKYGVERQAVLASSKVEEIREWKALVPESETLLWMHGNEEKLSRELAALRQTDFAGVTSIQIHVYPKETSESWAPPTDESGPENPFRLRNSFLIQTGEELRTHGIVFQTFPYTTDPSVYAKLLDLGVMSFATDHPDDATREVKAYYAAKAISSNGK